MLDAMLAGVTEAEVLAELARKRLRAKLPALREALEGQVGAIHRHLLRQLLDLIDFLQAQIEQLSANIEAQLSPYETRLSRLMQIPGIGRTAAAAILAEIGTDMSCFPSAKHLASWAGVCPGNKQSGGKRLSGATTPGNPYVRAILVEIAWAVAHTKDNYLSAFYHRMARRRGKHKAIMALCHKILIILYHVLQDKESYVDLGSAYFDQLDAARLQRHHVKRLEQPGYSVTLLPKDSDMASLSS